MSSRKYQYDSNGSLYQITFSNEKVLKRRGPSQNPSLQAVMTRGPSYKPRPPVASIDFSAEKFYDEWDVLDAVEDPIGMTKEMNFLLLMDGVLLIEKPHTVENKPASIISFDVHENVETRCASCTGVLNNKGGVLRSQDNGKSWNLRASDGSKITIPGSLERSKSGTKGVRLLNAQGGLTSFILCPQKDKRFSLFFANGIKLSDGFLHSNQTFDLLTKLNQNSPWVFYLEPDGSAVIVDRNNLESRYYSKDAVMWQTPERYGKFKIPANCFIDERGDISLQLLHSLNNEWKPSTLFTSCFDNGVVLLKNEEGGTILSGLLNPRPDGGFVMTVYYDGNPTDYQLWINHLGKVALVAPGNRLVMSSDNGEFWDLPAGTRLPGQPAFNSNGTVKFDIVQQKRGKRENTFSFSWENSMLVLQEKQTGEQWTSKNGRDWTLPNGTTKTGKLQIKIDGPTFTS